MEADVEPGIIFEFLADPRHLLDWEPSFADEVNEGGSRGWRVTEDGEVFTIGVVAASASCNVDYLRKIGPAREAGALTRTVPWLGGGSVVVLTFASSTRR